MDQRLMSKDWRMKNLYKIVDKQKRLVTFKRNEIQENLASGAWTRNIVLKSRQMGITTDACIDGLDDVLFHRNFNMVIIAHELEAVKKIFKKIKVAWDEFPKSLKAIIGFEASTDNKNELSFNNGSTIRVALSSRSDTVNRLHISEFGKICAKYPLKAEEIITGAIPSVPEDGRIDIESTAEGEFGAFHDMFWEAWDRGEPQAKKQFKAFFYPWCEHEEYGLIGDFKIPEALRLYQRKYGLSDVQINWYFIERETLKDKMKQENPTTPEEAFEASGFKMFDGDLLEWQKQWLIEGVKIGDWTIFKPYNPSHRYGMGADVAEGLGQDSSTAKIIDFTTNEEVASYKSNKIAPDLFAYELLWGSRRYGDCIICPERNNHGHTTIATLKTLNANLWEEIREGEKQDVKTRKYGWNQNGASKPFMMFELSDVINEQLFKLHDRATFSELRTYDKRDLSVVHFDPNQTKHWDLLIALAIAWQMRKYAVARLYDSQPETFKPFDPYAPFSPV